MPTLAQQAPVIGPNECVKVFSLVTKTSHLRRLPSGVGGENAYYVHDQAAAATEWEITHNLGRPCDITILDSLGRELLASVFHTSVNTATISFTAAISGTAYCH